MTATILEPKTGRGNIAALMTALLAACVAFQLNASMLSPALVTMGEELKTDQAVIGLSQTGSSPLPPCSPCSCPA